ncbi:MAG: TonB-dependent receptor [Nitrososphaera sp.]|nr:TonB-dependent receptor [Nitrososphaera sp.]MCI0708451.1 TonB-dependent receptor [Ignavibacteriota bacterium]
MMRRFALALISLMSLAAALNAAPHAYGITGILEGRILDKQTGSPLAGVNIVIIDQPQGGTTDAEGYYQIKNIRAGSYDVRYSIIGYTTVVMKGVTILPDLRTKLDVQMETTTIELDVIEVRAERPLIQKDLAATAYSIGDIKLDKLPITAFQDVLTLQPGTTVEGNVRGGKTTEVTYLIDGLPVQDVVGGGLGTNLPRSSISGLTIHTGGFDAEYGNALSGVVNVVTKTGGSEPTYSIRLEKDNWLPESINKQVDRATELEVTAAGPILPEKLSYFTANTFIAHDTRWWQDFSKEFTSPISQEFSGFGKLEYQFSPTLRLGFQGIYSLRKWRDYEFSWRFNLGGLPLRYRDSYRLAAVLSHTLSENSFYTLSLSRYYLNTRIGEGSKDDLTLQPYEYDFFLRYIIAGTRNWWADTKQAIYTFKGDYTTQIEKTHLIKIGVEINQFDIFSDLVKYEPQTTYFGKPIVDQPLLNYSNSYKYQPRSGSVFIQDKVELVRDGSNFSVGVRWDFLDPTAERPIVEFIPISQNEFEQQVTGFTKAKIKHQISPRISLAGPVGVSSFFFLNFGHYFQYPLFDYLYSGINPAQLRAGTKSVLAGNPDLEPERTVSWELGFKHGINKNVVASLTYFKKNTKNQIDSKTLIAADSKFAGDYGFASYVNNAEATSSGLEVLLIREYDERLSGSISYSYMVTEGVSEYVDQRINFEQWGFPLAARPFPLSWDQRHTVKVDADFKLPYDIRSNVIVLYNSPRPYTYYPTRDGFTPSDTSKLLLPNNSRMEDVMFFNVKLTRRFAIDEQGRYTLTVFADVRNLINKKNVRWFDSSGRVGGELGDPGAYYDPRRVRVGARLEF